MDILQYPLVPVSYRLAPLVSWCACGIKMSAEMVRDAGAKNAERLAWVRILLTSDQEYRDAVHEYQRQIQSGQFGPALATLHAQIAALKSCIQECTNASVQAVLRANLMATDDAYVAVVKCSPSCIEAAERLIVLDKMCNTTIAPMMALVEFDLVLRALLVVEIERDSWTMATVVERADGAPLVIWPLTPKSAATLMADRDKQMSPDGDMLAVCLRVDNDTDTIVVHLATMRHAMQTRDDDDGIRFAMMKTDEVLFAEFIEHVDAVIAKLP